MEILQIIKIIIGSFLLSFIIIMTIYTAYRMISIYIFKIYESEEQIKRNRKYITGMGPILWLLLIILFLFSK